MLVEPEGHDTSDDRVICRMDVEGMPPRGLAWNYIRRRHEQVASLRNSHPSQLTSSEAWRYTRYSVLAGLSLVLVYTVALVLFILFCTAIWFR